MDLFKWFRKRRIVVVRASRKEQREAEKRQVALHLKLARECYDVQFLARMGQIQEVK